MAKRRSGSTGQLQRMGGKEERVSEIGKARARLEAREQQGEARFDEAPGPGTDELLRGPKGSPSGRPRRKVSRKLRAGPDRLEPEDKVTSHRRGSLRAKLHRQPKEQLPRNPGEPPAAGEVPD